MTDSVSERDPARTEIGRIISVPSAGRLVRHLNQIELSRRWSMSPRTLERWRYLKDGPPYLRIGGKILYRLEDVESFEAAGLIATTRPQRLEASR